MKRTKPVIKDWTDAKPRLVQEHWTDGKWSSKYGAYVYIEYLPKNKKDTINTRPHNIEKLSVAEMKNLFPEGTRRSYAHYKKIYAFWSEAKEGFNIKSEKDFNNGINYGFFNFGVLGSYTKNSGCFACGGILPLERAHLVSACYGGPGQAWNIALLCHNCHKEFDNSISGKPCDYWQAIYWIRTYYRKLMHTSEMNIKRKLKEYKIPEEEYEAIFTIAKEKETISAVFKSKSTIDNIDNLVDTACQIYKNREDVNEKD